MLLVFCERVALQKRHCSRTAAPKPLRIARRNMARVPEREQAAVDVYGQRFTPAPRRLLSRHLRWDCRQPLHRRGQRNPRSAWNDTSLGPKSHSRRHSSQVSLYHCDGVSAVMTSSPRASRIACRQSGQRAGKAHAPPARSLRVRRCSISATVTVNEHPHSRHDRSAGCRVISIQQQ